MADPSSVSDQNILPVQAFFNVDGTFQTFIGQGQPFYATVNPSQSGLNITNSTINSTTIGAITPSTGVFTNIATTTGTISTLPSSSNDIANKLYVDSYVAGLSWKPPVNYGTTASITLSGLGTQGGGDWTTSLTAGMRILVKNQATAANNGIYIADSSTWSRAPDADAWTEFVSALVFVETGATLAGSAWYCSAQPGGTLGTTAINWSNFSVAAQYAAGTGLSLNNYVFSITNTGVTAATYGSASSVPVFAVNAQGQLTSVTNTSIGIAGSQITSGTIDTARISGSYTGITGVGTLTAGTWNAGTIGVGYGGTGATTLTGYVKGNGASAFTASTTVPTTDLSGTITNAQLANSTISGVALGGNLFSLTIGSGLSGTSYNGSAAVTITNSAPMVYPAAGIPSSTGTAWNTSYSTTGTGTVLALATGPTLNNPTISNYESYTSNSAPAYQEGRVWYDSTQKAISYYNDATNNVVHVGQETQLKVYNNTGSTITKGSPVYVTSTSSGFTYPLIALAKADNQTTGACIGLTNQDIPNATAGYVVIAGLVTSVNTGSFTVGDILYVSPYSAGQLMNTYPPTGYAIKIGVVAYANTPNGNIYVNQSNAYVVSNGIIGQVAIANGGTNGTATPTAGAVAYGSGTAYAFTSAGTSGQVLTSNGSSAPTWTTPTAYATVTDDTTTASTRYPLFASVTAGNLTTEYVSSTKLQYVPSTGVLTATSFSGAGTGLTGTASSLSIGGTALNVTGTVAVGNGGTGVTTLTGLAYGNGTSAFTAATAAQVVSVIGSTAVTNATNATNIGITDDTTTATSVYPTWVTTTTGNLPAKTASTKLSFVPSTGVLSATSFTGAGTGLTGTASSLSIGGNAANVTGTVAVGNGGTGSTTLTANNVLLGNGTSALQVVAPGTSGNVLTSNGTTWVSSAPSGGGSAATATALGTVYGRMTTSGASPYLTALGYNAAPSTTGASNTAVGTSALYTNSTGTNNTAVGYQAGYSNSTGTNITAVGYQALYNNTGSESTAVGVQALYSNTSGTNVAVGKNCLQSNTSGTGNIGIGPFSALYSNTTGGSNVAIGQSALFSNTTASNNTAVGYQALYSATGADNTSIGTQAGNNVTSGTLNVFVGRYAGSYFTSVTTTTGHTMVGAYASPANTTSSGETVIGYNLQGKGTNYGFYGGSAGVYNQANTLSWAVTSDQRIKKNIVDLPVSLSKIVALRPVEFDYKENDKHEVGFIAQEYEQVLPDQIIHHDPNEAEKEWVGEDKVKAIQQNLVPYLVKAIQEQQALITQLQADVAALKGAQA